MDAPPADAASSTELEDTEANREAPTLVRYYRIDFQRCVIQRGRRPSRIPPPEKR